MNNVLLLGPGMLPLTISHTVVYTLTCHGACSHENLVWNPQRLMAGLDGGWFNGVQNHCPAVM